MTQDDLRRYQDNLRDERDVVALSTVGLLSSLFKGRNRAFSALRQALLGCVAAAVTDGVGAVLGVSLS